MKSIEYIDFENFKKYDYALYEQRHFRCLINIYDRNNVKYKIIAINLFKNRQKAPIVVDLKSMKENELQDFYENIFLKEMSAGLNLFNNMGLVSNLIKSQLDLEEFSNSITELLKYNSKNIIRFYDPRVNIHLLNISMYLNFDYEMRQWLKRFNNIFEEWCVSVFGCHFEFRIKKHIEFEQINFSIQDIDKINLKFKQKNFKTAKDIQIFLKENYKRLHIEG